MKTYTQMVRLLLVVMAGFFMQTVIGQTGVLDPADPITIYNPQSAPATPAKNVLAKWVKTNRLSWNTSEYKCYYYNGMAFRLKFPKSYSTANDGKTYPLYVFFHGKGETGTIYDNEYQLFHGGDVHVAAVDNGQFDGFLLYPQINKDGWGAGDFATVSDIITKYLIPQVKVDQYRILVNGLSAGGTACWQFMFAYPKLVAAALPISSAFPDYINSVQSYKWTPMWHFQGGKDVAPNPSVSRQLGAQFLNVYGTNYTYTEYPNLGHASWDAAWAEPDYFPFMLRANKLNPWVLFGRTQFCPSDAINVVIGVTKGFDSYQWRKDGNIIANANADSIKVTSLGTYDCSVLNNGVWSAWSPTPVVISIKQATVPPAIQLAGLESNVFPAPDSSNGVLLQVPSTYVGYIWKKNGNDTILPSTTYQYKATKAGQYIVKVTEKYGCSSDFSAPYTVIDANGANGPDAPFSLIAAPLSYTTVKLNWSQNASPVNNETGFEIYRATASAGPYTLTYVTGADVSTYTVQNLNPGTNYFFKIRAINGNGASAVTTAVTTKTLSDLTPPTSPLNLVVAGYSKTSVDLAWNSATDNVAVTSYDIYVNGVKAYSTVDTAYTVYGLTTGKTYNFTVKAKDFAGNSSAASNQATASTHLSGLIYKYYQGTWSTLPDFNTLTPVASGIVPNITLENSLASSNYGFVWQGYINVPVAGSYTFKLNSDDGSSMYLGALNATTLPYNFSTTPFINNDGAHASQDVNATVTLSAGVYPIAVAFFQAGGGANCNLYWSTPQTNGGFVSVPDNVFTDNFTAAGTAPSVPVNFAATATSFNVIKLNWSDTSSNIKGFEIYRSTSANGTYQTINTVAGNVFTYTDSSLQPSTTYYYRIKAVGKYGESALNDANTGALTYRYYETGSLSQLPDLSTYTPTTTGSVSNFSLDVRNRDIQYVINYKGIINIPATGNYTFYTASDDGSNLYIDGNLVVNNDGLHGTVEQSGVVNNLTAGLHNIAVNFFQNGGGQVLTVSYQSATLPKQAIPDAVLGLPPVNATTTAIPGTPAIPYSLAAVSQSSSVNKLTWSDSSNNETAVQVYRSFLTNTGYQQVASLAPNTTSYADSSLAPNSAYSYKVRNINLGGASGYSNEVSVTTLNDVPVIAAIGNKSVKYGGQLQVNVTATDPDNEQLTLSFANLPAFASFASSGNGTGVLSFYPQSTDQGVYTGITVTVTDQHGGTSNMSFNLSVNNYSNPTLAPVSGLTLPEGGNGSISLSATEPNAGNSISWSFQNLPAFITPVLNGTSATLQVKPSYADSGSYNITAIITDEGGGTSSQSFVVNVSYANPNTRIFVNFNDGTNVAPAPWNNTNKATPTLNDVFTAFKDENGNTTSVGIKLTSKWQAVGNAASNTGYSTGNNSGVYPDAVLLSTYYSNATVQTFKISGLDTATTYNLTFLGSKSGSGNRNTQYTVNGSSASVDAAYNTRNTATILNLKPGADSSLNVSMQLGAGNTASYSYINALVITKVYNDRSTPAAPKNFTAALQGAVVNLAWTDGAYNETGYEVARATNAAGPFQLLTTTPAGGVSYTDSSIAPQTTYYYKVRAVNTYGGSAYTATVQVAVPNKPPVIAAISNQTLKSDQLTVVAISATNVNPGGVLTLSATGLPSFASLADSGNGKGSISFNPALSQVGVYNNITVTAKDNYGGSISTSFNATVINKNLLASIYVNFNGAASVAAPWNNVIGSPIVNRGANNLLSDAGVNTGANIFLEEAWTAASATGAVTGNNSGVYPDVVMGSLYYDQTTSVKHIKLTGLATGKRYNLTFFGSRGTVTDSRITTYAIGSQSVSLNATGNTSQTVEIDGVLPDASNSIEVAVSRGTGSSYVYINAMVIQVLNDDGLPTASANLTAAGQGKNNIVLNWTNKSFNATTFEIWSAPSPNGTYTLIDSVPVTQSTYTNTGLAANSVYYYKVRARNNSGQFSAFTNTAGASTLASTIDIQFNFTSPAGAPWNSTTSTPYNGFALNNMNDDTNQPTGVNMTVVQNFSGTLPYGMTTGNNSGVYPDKVIQNSWYNDQGDTGIIRIDGLDQTKLYNFTFFGSQKLTGTRISTYQIGSQVTSLNVLNNTKNTTAINGVKPDSTGAIYVSFYEPGNSIYGCIGALVIDAYSNANDTTGLYNNLRKTTGRSSGLQVAIPDDLLDNSLAGNKIASYPNPFVDDITIKVNLKQNVKKLSVVVTDLNGKVILAKQFEDLPKGIWQQNLGLKGRKLASGMYQVQLSGIPGEKTSSIKIVK